MVDTSAFGPVTERRYHAFDSLIAEALESEVSRPTAAAGQGPSMLTKKVLVEESREAAHDMIIAYLIREGHAETAKSMITAAAAASNATPLKSGALDSTEKRRAVYHMALESLDIRKRTSLICPSCPWYRGIDPSSRRHSADKKWADQGGNRDVCRTVACAAFPRGCPVGR